MKEVIIIGAGLSGLATSYQLKKRGIDSKVLESQNRLGGRIETIYGNAKTPMEMGATWFGTEHKNLLGLMSELKIDYFEQHTEGIALFETMSFKPPQQYFVPANSHSAFRVKGGTYSIIEALCKHLDIENISLNTQIIEVIDNGDNITIIDSLHNKYVCKKLIIALPPKLLINTIRFTPTLPKEITQIMQSTQTWMSGSIKFSVEYNKAFWKNSGFSGSVFSQSGIAPEIYDHSNYNDTKFALKGFLNGLATQYSLDERKERLIAQLKNYFGDNAEQFESYNDKIWNDKYIQPDNDILLPAHFNNGHALFEENYMNNKLFFTGTEVSSHFSGYMEGAIMASNSIIKRISKII